MAWSIWIFGLIIITKIYIVTSSFHASKYEDAYDYDYYHYDDRAQTEGDRGYDYQDVPYDDPYDGSNNNLVPLEPQFDVTRINVTVVEGQKSVLPCSITNLGNYKVSWIRLSSLENPAGSSHHAVLTFEDRRVYDDFRLSIVRPQIREWNLQIQSTAKTDEGVYICAINTQPVRNKTVVLYVKVPPEIIDAETSGDITANEYDTVVLTCKAAGVPPPMISWRRIASALSSDIEPDNMNCDDRFKGSGYGRLGETLVLENITRNCAYDYQCIADNSVNPRVTRRMSITVQFPPEVTLSNDRIAQILGGGTILDCTVTAFPAADMYWEKSGKIIKDKTDRYKLDRYGGSKIYEITLSLMIYNIEETDYGQYKCIASNSLGRASAQMTLYSKESKSDSSSTTSGVPQIHYYPPGEKTTPFEQKTSKPPFSKQKTTKDHGREQVDKVVPHNHEGAPRMEEVNSEDSDPSFACKLAVNIMLLVLCSGLILTW